MEAIVAGVAFMAVSAITAGAQTFNEWRDPHVNEVNRLPMHTSFFAYPNAAEAGVAVRENSVNYLSLNGVWKFNWVQNLPERPTDFFVSEFDDSGWDDMRVPAVWELNGYGDPVYVNIGWPWKGHYENNPPYVPEENNHVGSYRRVVEVPEEWSGKEIVAHFGSVTSNLYFWVNGEFVGYSEDSKLEAEFDVTDFVHPGENLFAMQVFRWCDGTYLEDQDFMRYAGVGRDCFLFAREKGGIRDIRVTPDLDENYVDGSLTVEVATSGECDVALVLKDAEGEVVAQGSIEGSGIQSAVLEVAAPKKWTAETPYLYTLTATSSVDGKVLEVIPLRAGFRKVEIRGAQLLVNGEPVLFKGADRHELDPDGGYYVSKERMLQDVRIMKEMNINGVRTCHYPDDYYWYELCDEYGIYVVAEANAESHGMGYDEETLAKVEDFKVMHLERNMRHVQRNFNHPSVVVWSLGNEAGNGPNFYACYEWVKKEDPSRPVQYERAQKDWNTDIYCPMYLPYEGCVKYCENNPDKPLILCEYGHAMGNSEGGFAKYWEIIRSQPNFQGGFIWDFVDQSPRKEGKNGALIYGYAGDWNDWDDNEDKNFCDNGLISPDRVWNPHAYEVRHVYQPVWTKVTDGEKGVVEVYNEHFFRDISNYYMEWTVLADGSAVAKGVVSDLEVQPQGTAECCLGYDLAGLPSGKEILLNVEYRLKRAETLLPAGYVVAYQQFELAPYEYPALVDLASLDEAVVSKCDGEEFVYANGLCGLKFNAEGWLVGYEVGGRGLLAEGSVLRPNFWRAPTDNDMGAGLQNRLAVWKSPTFALKDKWYKVSEDGLVYCAVYDMPEVQGVMTMTYLVAPDGMVQVSEGFEAAEGVRIPPMFRFGMRLEMPQSYDSVEYYGRGPWENYADRMTAAQLGVYRQSVAEQFYPYIRVQETGTRSDLRWWSVLDVSGSGLLVSGDAPFSASALEYSMESLDEGEGRGNTHSQEIEKADVTCLCIDKVQMGLGCIDSWGAVPEREYFIPYQSRTFTFTLTPVFGQF